MDELLISRRGVRVNYWDVLRFSFLTFLFSTGGNVHYVGDTMYDDKSVIK